MDISDFLSFFPQCYDAEQQTNHGGRVAKRSTKSPKWRLTSRVIYHLSSNHTKNSITLISNSHFNFHFLKKEQINFHKKKSCVKLCEIFFGDLKFCQPFGEPFCQPRFLGTIDDLRRNRITCLWLTLNL